MKFIFLHLSKALQEEFWITHVERHQASQTMRVRAPFSAELKNVQFSARKTHIYENQFSMLLRAPQSS